MYNSFILLVIFGKYLNILINNQYKLSHYAQGTFVLEITGRINASLSFSNRWLIILK